VQRIDAGVVVAGKEHHGWISKGRSIEPFAKFKEWSMKCQGTTLVVPKWQENLAGL